jgi:putative molybdopterin biosynthesis protein
MAIESVARANNLGFIFYKDERYDFVVPKSRLERPAVQAFVRLLSEDTSRQQLAALGFCLTTHDAETCRR